jgi:hypothetical protein
MELLSFILDVVLFGMIIWFVFTWAVSRHLERQIGSVVQDLDQERLIPLTVEVDQKSIFLLQHYYQGICMPRTQLERNCRKI